MVFCYGLDLAWYLQYGYVPLASPFRATLSSAALVSMKELIIFWLGATGSERSSGQAGLSF